MGLDCVGGVRDRRKALQVLGLHVVDVVAVVVHVVERLGGDHTRTLSLRGIWIALGAPRNAVRSHRYGADGTNGILERIQLGLQHGLDLGVDHRDLALRRRDRLMLPHVPPGPRVVPRHRDHRRQDLLILLLGQAGRRPQLVGLRDQWHRDLRSPRVGGEERVARDRRRAHHRGCKCRHRGRNLRPTSQDGQELNHVADVVAGSRQCRAGAHLCRKLLQQFREVYNENLVLAEGPQSS
mmetsp:Transcript_81968/g.264641  ORF Transcript_81968/g.264641 Transcript_81968/m.264641 type:complete len:238 (+) Transcript_81968:655-1368(+)